MKDPKIIEPSIVKSYNNYYSSGVYKSLYDDKVNQNVIDKIGFYCSNLSKLNNNIISILDFGAGDGRLYSYFKDIAAKLPNNIIRIVAYDISDVGLDIFAEKMKKDKFIYSEIDATASGKEKIRKFSKNNLEISLLLGNLSMSSNDIIELTKNANNFSNFDLSIALFGVISHIAGNENRFNMIKLLDDAVARVGIVMFTVPNAEKNFKKEQDHYNFLINEQGISSINSYNQLQKGDIFYTRPNSNVKNYYHLFDYQEINNILANYQPEYYKISIDTIKKEPDLVKSNILQQRCDFYLSRKLSDAIGKNKSQSILSSLPSYYMVEFTNNKEMINFIDDANNVECSYFCYGNNSNNDIDNSYNNEMPMNLILNPLLNSYSNSKTRNS